MNSVVFPDDFDKRVKNAIDVFWGTRAEQENRQISAGVRDQGHRGAVTGGKQLDGFTYLIRDMLILNQVPTTCIFTHSNLELPGYYRPNKKWDLLVVDRKELIVAVELKSQVGPSFGNNFNNRTEEAMGTALDLWTAYREGVFGTQKAPWLGYFMLLECCTESGRPVHVRSPHFEVLREFQDASYQERYEIFCRKLLLERQYSSACFMIAQKKDSSYLFPDEHLSLRAFLLSMLGAVMFHFSEVREVRNCLP